MEKWKENIARRFMSEAPAVVDTKSSEEIGNGFHSDSTAEIAREKFVDVYQRRIHRPGFANFLHWLLYDTDFMEAPASMSHHLAIPGGLVIHSVNVYNSLRDSVIRATYGQTENAELLDTVEERVAILGLLHDVCKVGCYFKITKQRKVYGKLEEYQGYGFHDNFPLGHGEKSLYLISRFMELDPEEALAIRWHMGAYDDAVKGGSKAMSAAMEKTIWVWLLQQADMEATHDKERGGNT